MTDTRTPWDHGYDAEDGAVCPYPPGSAERAEWLDGYAGGAEEFDLGGDEDDELDVDDLGEEPLL